MVIGIPEIHIDIGGISIENIKQIILAEDIIKYLRGEEYEERDKKETI